MRASCPGELQPQQGSCLLLSPEFHKMPRGGSAGRVELLNPFYCCRQGRIAPQQWMGEEQPGWLPGLVPRCGEQAAVWAAETCHKLLVGVSAFLVHSSLVVFGSWGCFFPNFPCSKRYVG